MHFANEPIFQWLAQYAYQADLVYLFVFGMMVASAFGLPLPEEITIVSLGVLAYMGANPDLFPPPEVGAQVVNKYWASTICVSAILLSDLIIYSLGRKYGGWLLTRPRLKSIFSPENMEHVQKWTKKYGIWAVFIFRFTPGVRFPGHLACGVLRISLPKFIMVDAFAALISVPTQIILIATYGETILKTLHRFKTAFLIVAGVLIVVYFGYKLSMWWLRRQRTA